jgi:hypothetical protein
MGTSKNQIFVAMLRCSKKLLLTYHTYAAAQFFARALPNLENWIFRGSQMDLELI